MPVIDFIDTQILTALAENKGLTCYALQQALRESRLSHSVLLNRLRRLERNHYVLREKIRGRRNHDADSWKIDKHNVRYKNKEMSVRWEGGDVLYIKKCTQKERAKIFTKNT